MALSQVDFFAIYKFKTPIIKNNGKITRSKSESKYLVLSDQRLTVPHNKRDANKTDEEQSKTLWALQVIGRVAVPPLAARH